MNAVLNLASHDLRAIEPQHLPAVLAVEQRAYSHPWTEGNFRDALRVGYDAHALWMNQAPGEALVGYFVAMRGVDEMHLLNITVAPEWQRQRWGHWLFEALVARTRALGMAWLWLEVRASNTRALRLYEAQGLRRVGLRRGYYPLGHHQREDAVVMSLQVLP